MYSDRDIAELKQMITLMDDLGINIAGAEVIMRMARRISELQEKVKNLESELERYRKGDIG